MNRGYRLGGASRRRTDPPAAAQRHDNIVRDPFSLCVSRLTRDLNLRHHLGDRAHSLLTERIHTSLRSLARARRAGITVPIPDPGVSRIVDAVAKIVAPIEDPDNEPVLAWADLDDTTPADDPAREVLKEAET